MKKNIMIIKSLQELISVGAVEEATEKNEYKKSTRKLSMHELVLYLVIIALEQSKSYRDAVTLATKYGLPEVHYSELSKRVSDMPFEVMKEILEYFLEQCNRKFRRSINKVKGVKKAIKAVDSTIITTSKTQMKWAGYKGQRSGVKLHVQYDVGTDMPTATTESVAKRHDSKYADELKDEESILVEDRAYGKTERFDSYLATGQSFVIRIKDNLTVARPRKLKHMPLDGSNIIDDITCQLGKGKKITKNRFRVVIFKDNNGNVIKACTDLMNVNAETIAEIYKCRWEVESFFRFIKQNLNVSRIFGTTKNAVFNQLYAALLAYVIIRFLYNQTSAQWGRYVKLTMIEFIRALRTNNFPTEVFVSINSLFGKLAFALGS